MRFVFRAVDEVGATLNTVLVVTGDRLGLCQSWRTPVRASTLELAQRNGVAERYVREWLNAQAAGGFVEYDRAFQQYKLPPSRVWR